MKCKESKIIEIDVCDCNKDLCLEQIERVENLGNTKKGKRSCCSKLIWGVLNKIV